ncbi:cyclopropane-fatty-acyl-phospholipid synthase family protein [Amycolatopsis sp. cg5]|uniref:SAM-dependent methyltransferase n=1 Tax=Amycolatopsis sp. cg5 TaxID=3238802 RepID=UPI003523FA4F
MTMVDKNWTEIFTDGFRGPASPGHARIWAAVYGDEYPAALDTHSYITVSELDRMAEDCRLSPGDRLADIGCGRGGPGIWLAARRDARLVGIDIAETALEAAREKAEIFGLADRAAFQLGSFTDTNIATGSLQAVISIDALLFAPDKAAALAELARITAPGGRLLMTTWDYHTQPDGRPPQLSDHRPVIEAAASQYSLMPKPTAGVSASTAPTR